MKTTREQVKEALGLKRDSVTVDRVLNFLEAHNKELKDVKFAVTTDFYFTDRKNRVGEIVTYASGTYAYHTHIYYEN